jgi:antagonist of KipI
MSLFFKKAGILTSVQDLSRNNFRRFGINPNGAMDCTALRLINILLGNAENEAVLEMHYPAPEIVFEENTVFALGGADFAPFLDETPIENWRIHFAEKGCVLKFTGKSFGNRAYLSVAGGFRLEKWLTSASTNLKARTGGFHGRKIMESDKLPLNRSANAEIRNLTPKISNSLLPIYSKFPTVRVIEGTEFGLLTGVSQEDFLKNSFTITQNSDRMGFRLSGNPLYLLQEKELVSSAVNFGTIQLLPDGQLIVLMADHQTTGGYPRIGNVFSMDLPLLAQLGANEKIAFQLISVEEAENAVCKFENELNFLKTATRFL